MSKRINRSFREPPSGLPACVDEHCFCAKNKKGQNICCKCGQRGQSIRMVKPRGYGRYIKDPDPSLEGSIHKLEDAGKL